MPRRRRAPTRRRPRRKRRLLYGNKIGMMGMRYRVGVVPNRAPHYFKRTLNMGGVAALSLASGGGNGQGTSSTSDVVQFSTGNGGVTITTYYAGSIYFSLDQLPDYTEFTALFDRYKIAGVKVVFRSFNISSLSDVQGQANGQLGGVIHYITDYDDAAVPTASDVGVQALREHENYRTASIFNSRGLFLKRYVRPRIALAAYAGAFTSYANVKPMWIDAASPSVQHYGLKFIVELLASQANFTQNFNFTVECTYYVMCKDVR